MIHVIRASIQDVQVGDELHVYDSPNTLHVHAIGQVRDAGRLVNTWRVQAEVRRGGPLGSGDDVTLEFGGDQVVTLNRDQPED
jgi:hypothetical protein